MKHCILKKQIGFMGIALMLIGIGAPQKVFAKVPEIGKMLTYISSSVPYELEGDQEPPVTAVVCLRDERTGENYEQELPRIEVVENERVWEEDFFFSLTVSGYDADVFLLGEEEIPAGEDLSLYGNEFIEYLNLPEECYRVNRVEWNGDSYESEGVLCRDAVASGEKLVRYVDVKYGGEVWVSGESSELNIEREEVIEEETKVSAAEKAEYVQESETEAEEIEPPKEQEESFRDKIAQWIREHLMVVTMSILFLLGMIAAIILFFVSGRKKKSRVN